MKSGVEEIIVILPMIMIVVAVRRYPLHARACVSIQEIIGTLSGQWESALLVVIVAEEHDIKFWGRDLGEMVHNLITSQLSWSSPLHMEWEVVCGVGERGCGGIGSDVHQIVIAVKWDIVDAEILVGVARISSVEAWGEEVSFIAIWRDGNFLILVWSLSQGALQNVVWATIVSSSPTKASPCATETYNYFESDFQVCALKRL